MTEAEMLREAGAVSCGIVLASALLAYGIYLFDKWKKNDKCRRSDGDPPKSTGHITMDLQSEADPNVSTSSLRYLHELDRRQS